MNYYFPYLILNCNDDLVSLILPFLPPSHGEIKLGVFGILLIFNIGYLGAIFVFKLQTLSVRLQIIRTHKNWVMFLTPNLENILFTDYMLKL